MKSSNKVINLLTQVEELLYETGDALSGDWGETASQFKKDCEAKGEVNSTTYKMLNHIGPGNHELYSHEGFEDLATQGKFNSELYNKVIALQSDLDGLIRRFNKGK